MTFSSCTVQSGNVQNFVQLFNQLFEETLLLQSLLESFVQVLSTEDSPSQEADSRITAMFMNCAIRPCR
jgi:hypothetical protein